MLTFELFLCFLFESGCKILVVFIFKATRSRVVNNALCFTSNSFFANNIAFIGSALFFILEMATFHVHSGLDKTLRLPETQFVLIGRHKWLKNVVFDEILEEKLSGVNEILFNSAVKQLQPESSIPLYLNLATVRYASFF